jgi:5-methylcytosine-specific restriction endonuclease McrA
MRTPEQVQAALARGRIHAKTQSAKRRGARVERVTSAQLERLMQKQRFRCAICLVKIPEKRRHLDHVMPISRGGKHAISNLQWLCPPCNIEKRDKDPIDFMQKLGFLL